MGWEWRRNDRALVLECLQHGEYDAIATSSQGALDELAHLTAELGVWDALEVIQVHRERDGIPDDLLLRTLTVLPFIEAMGLSADAAVSTAKTPVTYEPAKTDKGAAARNGSTTITATTPVSTHPKRFHGSAQVDPTRAARDVGQIAEQVIQQLAGLVGAEVQITLEIHAIVPDGVPDHVVRTVTENCRTLRFTSQGFEEE